ncbi:type IX secretion system outer membrane channel protein PorV [Xanthovirga aplysinae]|uniref:type IX secretion system outer membrane channel protein PorV n=1 Tax=Xanthovirga aplysinae TaxID=2529853 RepID=UPI0012BB7E82|nr:type IX secretion system outer membrane channel protein PorV [Xanthovirga aplysinae]MTI32595.1 type IX secretion system outer membrane channel protein PorV [Xanthovirga aplysinae]
MNKSAKYFFTLSILFFSINFARAQNPDPINPSETAGQYGDRIVSTAVPFLTISPTARAAGMGDVGVATSADEASAHFNPAKYAFIKNQIGAAVSYTPWLTSLGINDMALYYLSGYKRLDNEQTIAFSLRYFNLGDIQFTDDQGNFLDTYMPREFAFDGTYARKLSERLSLGVSTRFIYSSLSSDISSGNPNTKTGITAAADIGAYYITNISVGNVPAELSFGGAITNIGAKITYSDSERKDFIPTNLKLGTAYTALLDDFNKLTISIDANKLLVPTPPIYDIDTGEIEEGKDPNRPLLSGIFGSFGDAPGGFAEEMQEITLAGGIEYWYNELFSARAGYFWENAQKGNRKYFTLGIGLKYQVFGLDVAYLIPQEQGNPLAETLRFTLGFNLDNLKSSETSVTD